MHIILLLLCLFVPAICFSNDITKDFDIDKVKVEKAIAPLVILGIASAIFSVAVSVYSYLQMRKQQKKNKAAVSQLDGSITGEGTIAHDIAGSPHLYGNDVEKFNFSTSEIKQKK